VSLIDRMSSGGEVSAEYLLGAMLADGVPGDLATRIAKGYAVALSGLEPDDLHAWRAAVASRIEAGEHTAFALICHPSDHEAPRYLELADAHRRKESYGNDAEPN
jgi:hypothetical protein